MLKDRRVEVGAGCEGRGEGWREEEVTAANPEAPSKRFCRYIHIFKSLRPVFISPNTPNYMLL